MNTLQVPQLGTRTDGRIVQLFGEIRPPAFAPLLQVDKNYALEILSVFFNYDATGVPAVQVGLYAQAQGVDIIKRRSALVITVAGGNEVQMTQGQGFDALALANSLSIGLGRIIIPPEGFLTPLITNDQVGDTIDSFCVIGIAWPVTR